MDIHSSKPLFQKLGIIQGSEVLVHNPPSNYEDLVGTSVIYTVEKENLSFIHLFVTTEKEYKQLLMYYKPFLAKNGQLWISWPKKGSMIITDLTENKIRDIALKNGLVDVKIVSIDTNWSGLKLVYRLKDR